MPPTVGWPVLCRKAHLLRLQIVTHLRKKLIRELGSFLSNNRIVHNALCCGSDPTEKTLLPTSPLLWCYELDTGRESMALGFLKKTAQKQLIRPAFPPSLQELRNPESLLQRWRCFWVNAFVNQEGNLASDVVAAE